jgi:hypothetical protein
MSLLPVFESSVFSHLLSQESECIEFRLSFYISRLSEKLSLWTVTVNGACVPEHSVLHQAEGSTAVLRPLALHSFMDLDLHDYLPPDIPITCFFASTFDNFTSFKT